jgi:hypothetical protein
MREQKKSQENKNRNNNQIMIHRKLKVNMTIRREGGDVIYFGDEDSER